MKKLLGREPTEEMIIAACGVKGMSYDTCEKWWIEHFKALFDAAPEVTVDMEPFGYLKRVSTSKSYIGNLSSDRPQEGVEAVYSFTQVGAMRHKDNQAILALQAENERMRKEAEKLRIERATMVVNLQDSSRLLVKLTAEQDELVLFLRKINNSTNMVYPNLNKQMREVLAKYEGEKHD